MKSKIKNLLLIIWVIVSFKILWLTGGLVLKILLSSVVKILPEVVQENYYLFISKYVPTEFNTKENFGIVTLIVSYLNLLLFSCVVNSWIFFFLKKKLVKNYWNQSFFTKISFFLLLIVYSYIIIEDLIPISYLDKNILLELQNTNFILILQILIIIVLSLSLFSIIIIYKSENWTLVTKVIISLLILILGYAPSFWVALVLIWKDGGLALVLNQSNFDPRELSQILEVVASYYNIPIALCNPENIHPCKSLQDRMHEACIAKDFISQFPLGGKSLTSNVLGQFAPIVTDTVFPCTEFRNAWINCIEDHNRLEFSKRWSDIQQHQPISAKIGPIFSWTKK